MTKPVKFFFDENFDSRSRKAEKASALAEIERQHQLELEQAQQATAQAREDAYAQGHADGQREALGGLEAQLSATLGSIAGQASLLMNQRVEAERTLMAEAARLSLVAARHLASSLVARQPMAEIEGLLRECLTAAAREPRLVIRLVPEQVDPLTDRLNSIKTEQNFTGDIIILGDPEMKPGDCRVEWPDGGAERSVDALETRLAETIDTFLAAELGSPTSPSPEAEAGA